MKILRGASVSGLAVRAYSRAWQEYKALSYIARHPREIIRHPEWLRQRTGVTTQLRTPWWPYGAVSWVDANLSSGARVFEYGGGGSTLWLEDRGAIITTVEHDESWYRQLAVQLAPSAELLFRPPTASGSVTSAIAPGFFDEYAAAIDEQPDSSLDFVIVDGRSRIACARRALQKVKPEGLLLVDDTDRERYEPVIEMLRSWERHVFTGLKAGQRFPAQTSVWRCPPKAPASHPF
jgi:hypothetical protein